MSVRVFQADDPPRPMSVQNPMSINDLMISQQRRLSTSAAAAPRNFRPTLSRQPQQPVQLPPRRLSYSPSRQQQQQQQEPQAEPEPEDMGYDMILNQQKVKKDDENNAAVGGGVGAGGFDDDFAPQPDDMDNGDHHDFINARERREFERGEFRPDLPPHSRVNNNNISPPRRLSVPGMRGEMPGFQPPSFGVGAGGGAPSDPFGSHKPYMMYEEQMEKKQKYLEGLDKFRRRGMKVASLDINSPFEEVENEYNRHKRTVDVEASIQFSRKMLMACVTGLEYLNSRYDPLGLQLDGWSESVIEDIHNYDDVFEKLYDKYHTSFEMAPEFELLLMVAGSAFMYHLTNSMFKSAMPGAGSAGNPDMMKNMRRGVMGAMRGAFNGASNGGGVTGMMSGMFGGGGGGAAASRSQQPQQQQSNKAGPPPPASSRSPRREMRAPSANMDDLLNNLMDREPAEVSERLVEEIDDILNNPSDEEDNNNNAPARNIRGPARAGPGGSSALPPNPQVVDI